MNEQDMIGVPVANFLTTHLPMWIVKPLFECLVCMSSIWTLVFWVAKYGAINSWGILVAVFIVAGMNTLISMVINSNVDVEEKD